MSITAYFEVAPMLVELITPLMIATAPLKVEVPPSVYDHNRQTSISQSNQQVAQYRAPSYNATRTYDFQGRPNDADSD